MIKEFLSSNGFTYKIEFDIFYGNKIIQISGHPDKKYLRKSMGGVIPVMIHKILSNQIDWHKDDNLWIPNDIIIICDKLVKNMAFL